jgi:DMSO/TMAO reductase YedYZ molybdopterin-dependent catalytic subunit
MNNDEKSNPLKLEDIPSTGIGSKQETVALPEACHEDANLLVPIAKEMPATTESIEEQMAPDVLPSAPVARESRTDAIAGAAKQEVAELPKVMPGDSKSSDPTATEKPVVIEATDLQVDADASATLSVAPVPRPEEIIPPSPLKSVLVNGHHSFFEEQPLPIIDMAPRLMRYRTRRDVLAFGIGGAAVITGAGYLLPKDTLSRLGVRRGMSSHGKEWLLNNALRVDDDVAEALYSQNRMVPTYTRSQITPIKNNYNGTTPEPWYISGWKLTLDGLASGLSLSLNIQTLMNRFSVHEQITRFVCVEGWSAIAWWAGLRFDDLLRAYPPKSLAKWARVESSVNLDNSGNPDPYFVSIDLATARHPQTLLATHHDGQPLTVEHGAPLRLLVPVKLGLKNVKAITRITYSAEEPKDYWTPFGYSSYDGI